VNNFCGVGHLTRNPIVRFEGDGVQTASATLAIEEPTTRGTPFVTYVGLTFWGKSAEAVSTLSANDLVSVVGKLKWRKLTDKNGQDKSSLVVDVRSIELLQVAAAHVEAGAHTSC
jgi:single-stranded DNA-binding protein